ncbi:hybrid non-ribosomal peptide synthetase/type I polyketide synthase (plasmid) [Vibrio coralliilyticus]|uniref:hybrid non-ribosomal peptide synthetase/type I polyketide synthase n=1 Tax=Vibrio coralliilyticus TaxID=190893 RepID=UPI000690439D|nr:hybrid non-ribosomal peptide synthetase/type I polyketide synthase [Vibrio coralliilyticus]
MIEDYIGTEIAIVGLAGQFPKAGDVESFWHNLCEGVSGVSWAEDFQIPTCSDDGWHVPAAYLLNQIDAFDEQFFGMSPKEASITDPQQRLLLQCAYQALVNAGYAKQSDDNLTGVFVSTGPSQYLQNHLSRHTHTQQTSSQMQLLIANDKDYAATRISYKLNLKGPSIVAQSACSSSLLCIHMACQSLLAGESDMALAGGFSIDIEAEKGYQYTPGNILSKDGKCRPFDKNASGTVRGNGGGIVVLKRLDEAIEDNDHIWAVIRGTAVNNDGASKVGFSAPSVDGQADVIRTALQVASVSSSSIGYIETHGTATALGDPIEIEALSQVFTESADAKPCHIGSVKSSIGHLDAGAGVAGLIKTALALHDGIIPATLHFREESPSTGLSKTPFTVVAKTQAWHQQPRRAGISSFGIGGTNVHQVLEQPPLQQTLSRQVNKEYLRFSAHSLPSLTLMAQKLSRFLKARNNVPFDLVKKTLQATHTEGRYRLSLNAPSKNATVTLLDNDSSVWNIGICSERVPKVAMMFPGQGTPYVGMAHTYFESSDVYRAYFHSIAEQVYQLSDIDLIDLIYGETDKTEVLMTTQVAQPALFAVEYALAQHWMNEGVSVEAFIGHSIGEYVAATLSGIFTLEDAVRLVVERGRIMQQAPPGDMLAIATNESRVRKYLPDSISVAAVNRRELIVVAGPTEDIVALQKVIESQDVVCKLIPTSHAFHSDMMDCCLDEYRLAVSKCNLSSPKVPLVSNLSGTWLSDMEACDPEYWVQHLRQTVKFIEGVETIVESGPTLFIECGPGSSLSSSVRTTTATWGDVGTIEVLPKLNPESFFEHQDRMRQLLWCHGVEVLDHTDLETFSPVLLPAYQFEERCHWVEPDSVVMVEASDELAESSLPVPEEQTTIQGKVSALWCEALGLRELDLQSNFFDLGGDSILSIQIAGKAKRLGVNMSANDLLSYPTLDQLVHFLESQTENEKSNETDVSLDIAEAYQPSLQDALQPFPLTDIQHAYWIGRNAGTHSGQVAAYAYEEFECDYLDVNRLQQALNQLIERHEMLRAVVDETGLQRILPSVPNYEIAVLDQRRSTPVEAESSLQKHRMAKSHQVFDTSQWPLFDMSVTLLPDESARLHIGFDLLILDAWSITLFWQELESRYHDQEKVWPELPIRFRDYVLAENRMMESDSFQVAKNYWLERLETFPRAPMLPMVSDVDTLTHHKFSRQETVIDKAVWVRLKEMGAALGLTPSTLLSTSYGEILAMWSETPHFCLNLPAFNRMDIDPAIDQLIGDFTSVLLFEMDYSRSESFEQRAKRNQSQLWRDIASIQYSGVKFLNELSEYYGERITVPYVFTSLIFPAAEEKPIISRLGRLVHGISQTPHVWLDCQVYEDEGNLVINWDSVDGLFDHDLLKNMFMDYRALLIRLVNAPEFWQDPHWQRPWLARFTQGSIATANRTEQKLPLRTLHHAVIKQCHKTPSAPALLGELTITYEQLNKASGYIAQCLSSNGVGPGNCVGVLLSKGWQQTVACLGILRTGAAYVPLSADIPSQRLGFIIEQAGITSVVTMSDLNQTFAWPTQVRRLEVEEFMLHEPCVWTDPVIPIESTAYIIYTSGTTGNPKGVVISHAAVNNTICDINNRFGLTSSDRTLAVSSLSFDLSVYDMFGPLSLGGGVVLPHADLEKDPVHWQECIERHQVTVWNTVPALMDMLVTHLEAVAHSCADQLRLIMMSGDWIGLSLPERIQTVFTSARCISLGGATEASIWSIFHEITTVSPHWKSIPYGKALANQTMWVLDTHLRPRPIGVSGEIFIGGVGLAEGYLGNPDETAYRFVHHPETGERLYRTGDLGRYLLDGSIEFLGREDNQVKVNGYRVETSEIDKRACQHSNVNAAITRAFEQSSGFQLVTYVCVDTRFSMEDFRKYLVEFLPDYMMPLHIIVMESLPLSANGKVDRKQLPEPEWQQGQTAKQTPSTQTERQVLALVETILNHDLIGVEEDLYRLGMDSRQLTNLVTQIRAQLLPEFPLRVAFESPTITAIANAIDRGEGKRNAAPVSRSISPTDDQPRLLSSAQMRLWFHEQLHPDSSTYNLVDPFMFKGPLDVECLKLAFSYFVARHDVLHSRIEDDQEPKMCTIQDGHIDFMVLSPRFSSPDEAASYVQSVIEKEVSQPMSMDKGELFRVRLIRKHEDEHVLIVTAHHIIWDGWSSAIMASEISDTYRRIIAGEKAHSMPPILQFHDYSVWEQQQLNSPLFKQQLSYWSEQLGQDLPILALPTESEPYVHREGGKRQAFVLDSALTARFDNLCQQQGITAFMGYMTIWQSLLSWWCQQDDIVVGTPAGHRADPQLTNMIGFIVNSLAIRQRIEEEVSVSQLFKRSKTTCLEAYANQDVPFDRVVQAIQPKRSLQESAPIYRTWFVLHDVPQPSWSLPGIDATLTDAHFLLDVHDLKLSLERRSGMMEGGLDYRCNLFSAQTIQQLCDTFQHLVSWVVAQPTDTLIREMREELDTYWSNLKDINRKNTALPNWDFSVSRRSEQRKSYDSK